MPTNTPPDYDKLWKACIEYENRIAQLEAALKYCQDDKTVMQNEIDVFKEQLQQAQAELEQAREGQDMLTDALYDMVKLFRARVSTYSCDDAVILKDANLILANYMDIQGEVDDETE